MRNHHSREEIAAIEVDGVQDAPAEATPNHGGGALVPEPSFKGGGFRDTNEDAEIRSG